MAAGSENSAIVRTIIALADNLGMTVVAEGIETEAQRAELSASGCEHAQGYLFARPAAASTIEELMRKQQGSSLTCTASKEPASLPLAIRASQLPEFAQCWT